LTEGAPGSWCITRFGAIFHERRETVSDKDFPALSVTKNGIVPQIEGVAKTDNGDSRKLVRRGDIVINSRSDRKGSSGLSDFDGSVSVICMVLRPRTGHPRFLHYLIRSGAFQEEFYKNGHGIVADLWTTRFNDAKGIRVALPDVDEQIAASEFLDHETAKADALVAKYERLIELLEEKRLALITQAVTKGLDPTVPLKDSGVEWIGRIPEHWEIWKLFHAVKSIGSGTTPPVEERKWYDGGIPFVTTAELRETVIIEAAKTISESALKRFTSLKLYPAGSIGIAMYGATIGRLGIFGIPATVNQACCVIQGSDILSSDYLYYWLMAKRNEIIALGVGGGQPNISQEIIRNLRVPTPRVSEQVRIVNHIREATAPIANLVSKAQRAIDLVKERRSALITATVTGRADVKAYGAQEMEIA